MGETRRDKNLSLFVLLALVAVAALFYFGSLRISKIKQAEETQFLELQKTFADAPILARAFSVYDITDQKEIYSREGDLELPLASLAKTMSVMVALRENPRSKMVDISPQAIRQDGNYGFSAGEKFRAGDLAKLTLIGSVNDGAYALAESTEDYLAKMNASTKIFGIHNTTFRNPTGLDLGNDQAGAYGTARDANQMAIYANMFYPDIFEATALPEIKIKSNLKKIYTIKNTDILLDKIPGLLFSKTGYTDLAGGNLTVIFKNRAGHKIAVSLLGSTREGRFTDMEKLVNLSYSIGDANRNQNMQ